ncbi:hypothetical protein PV371_09505 [Streptomyces sp. TX20-6-3]|uniref:hypothetical protein n=1 Tax=Streptomyces sp. TX20-6-3 TaxID=3028705 RepID=UPI0029BC7BC5|nr:hypothetical protein [Streptomyces sp. TX20-6-3]MDX2559885.1 hypothetical protein [Streptomyces sp. TX20-6-3]
MQRAGGERSVTVDNGEGIVVVGSHNRITVGAGEAVRSAYREQVRRIAPPELVGRDEELAELAAFCRADSGPAYAHWRADAWAGKTALMAWLALDPPPGVRIVPFFVTARLGAQNDVAAYTDVVLEQLAELAGEGLPALLTAATREAHLLRLYASAAEACAARGERLVLLVDGLDEDRGVTTGADAHSIASLLPYGLRVIVAGRPNPPLPADVPEDHPLRTAVVRTLAPSPRAHAIRTDAERELKRLLEAGGLSYDLLALLTAAGGGLTADDLAELTAAVPYRVKDVLRTGPGRTFAVRGETYLLAHEELATGAREMLGERELARWRAVLHTWADGWRERGWPDGTPDYLLHGYLPMLRAEGDVERLVDCAVDGRRHERLLAVTGGDAAALGEIGAGEDAVLGPGYRQDAVTSAALRLAMGRTRLVRESGVVPLALLSGWAAVGMPDRAVALARSREGVDAVAGLCTVAGKLLDVGEPERAMELVDEAEELTETLTADDFYGSVASVVTRLLGRLGAYDRAVRRLRTNSSNDVGGTRRALVNGLLAAGRYEEAVALGREAPDDGAGAVLRATVVEALVRAGRVAEAEREAHRPTTEPGGRAVVLLRASVAFRAAGHPGAADTASKEAMLERARMGPRKSGPFMGPLLQALVAAGEVEAARADSADGAVVTFVSELLRSGLWEEAGNVAGPMEGAEWASVRARHARELARAGDVERAVALAPAASMSWADPWPAIASAWLARGDLDAVASMCGRLVEKPESAWHRLGERSERLQVLGAFLRRLVTEGAVDRAHALVDGIEENPEAHAVFAEVLYDAGRVVEARALLAEEEGRIRTPPRAVLVGDLVALAGALAENGRREEAVSLLRTVEHEPGLDPVSTVPAALAAGRTEWAEALAWGGSGSQRWSLLPRIVAAHAAEGAFDRALLLVGHRDAPPNLLAEAVVAFAEAGAWDLAAGLASTRDPVPGAVVMHARMALASARQGRTDEARVRLEAVGRMVPRGRPVPLDAVRAEYALGEGLRASFGADSLVRQRKPGVTELALVLMGGYDEALDFFRSTSPRPGNRLADLVTELLRASQYGHAAALLDGMHHLGPWCGQAYALLARAEPDPGRARRWAVLALRLGEWRDVLPAVVAVDPGSVPLVLAEADRLRRALEV